ncbi:MAG: hypothetical protein Q8P13_03280 [bacterium]|nr:hypothetical protein [bacterium]
MPSSPAEETGQFRNQLFNQVIATIKSGLETGSLRSSRASEIADFVLKKLQASLTTTEIYQLVPTFRQTFPELNELSISVGQHYEELVKNEALPKALALIRAGKIQEANQFMKSLTSKESK